MVTKECFIISPLGQCSSHTRERADAVLTHLIRPALSHCGYHAVRGDEIAQGGMVTNQVIQCLVDSPLAVADLTGHNPNVFYELAIRHATKKPVIHLIEEGHDVPFDVAAMRAIGIHIDDPASLERSRQRLIAQIHTAMSEPAVNPISMWEGSNGRKLSPSLAAVEGKRLFQYPGYYPIDLGERNVPTLNAKVYVKAVKHFLNDEYDRLAALDLAFLREDNRPGDIVSSQRDVGLCNALLEKYELLDFAGENFIRAKRRLFHNYIRLVNDIGDTLSGVYFEILLHNVLNPIRSIIAARNSEAISERRVGNPSTRFVVQFVRNQGRFLIPDMESGSHVAYLKQFNRVKQVKATTTPIYHPRYGLIGIVCVNIDVDAIHLLDEGGRKEFFARYVQHNNYTPEFEKDVLK